MINVIVRTEPKPYCPDCGSVMLLRHRRVDKKPFWGCATFPDCNGTRDIDEDGLPVYDEIDEADNYSIYERYPIDAEDVP